MNVEDTASQTVSVWLKKNNYWVYASPGCAKTLVRRGGMKKLPFDDTLSVQYLCQKLPKLVDVC